MSNLELLHTETIALPIYSWEVDLTIEEDRPLPYLEETILRLAQAGVSKYHRFLQLLGIEERHLARAFADLRIKGALSAQNGSYEITFEGIKFLEKTTLRTLRKTLVRLWHDPYLNTLALADFDNDDLLTDFQRRESGLRALPAPAEMRGEELSERYREIQVLIRENGLPDDPDNLQDLPERYLVNATAKGYSTAFLIADLSVLRHPITGELAYLVKRNGQPDKETSLALRNLSEKNIDVVPFEPIETLSPKIQGILDRLITLERTGEVLENDDPRITESIQRAIPNAEKVITLFSPFEADNLLNIEILRQLRTRLLKSPNLRAQVILTGSSENNELSGDVLKLLPQIQKIEQIGSRLKFYEAYSLKAEGVIVDFKWGIIALQQYIPHPWKRRYGYLYKRIRFVSSSREIRSLQEKIHETIE